MQMQTRPCCSPSLFFQIALAATLVETLHAHHTIANLPFSRSVPITAIHII
jgi:hypothetical protein